MTEPVKPLSYQSLQCVVQYMNAIKRFQSAACLSSIRNVQKLVPLTLDFLQLDDRGFTIDGSQYICGTILGYQLNRGDLPDNVLRLYNNGGLDYDVGLFGHEVIDRRLMPGDIVINQDQHRDRGDLNPGVLPLYNSYVRLIHFKNSGIIQNSQRSVRFENGIKLRDAVRRINCHYFGGRRTHYIKRLVIGNDCSVLNLPEGLKFKIRELDINNNGTNGINAMKPILDESSFPLQNLSVNISDAQDLIFGNEVLKTSASLSLNFTGRSARFWTNRLISLTNMKVHLPRIPVSQNVLIALARHWLQNSRQIGSKFSMRSQRGYRRRIINNRVLAAPRELGENLQTELGAIKGVIPIGFLFYPGWTIKMNLTSELNIFECRQSKYNLEVSRNDRLPNTIGDQLWIFMEVMEIGSARLPSGDSINVSDS